MPRRAAEEPPASPTVVPLRYVGDGRFIVGVPARDLTVTQDEADRLVASGLYKPEEPTDQAATEDTPDE